MKDTGVRGMTMEAEPIERSGERRHVPRGGRRSDDYRRPWWQHGLVLAALAIALRYWRKFRRSRGPSD